MVPKRLPAAAQLKYDYKIIYVLGVGYILEVSLTNSVIDVQPRPYHRPGFRLACS